MPSSSSAEEREFAVDCLVQLDTRYAVKAKTAKEAADLAEKSNIKDHDWLSESITAWEAREAE